MKCEHQPGDLVFPEKIHYAYVPKNPPGEYFVYAALDVRSPCLRFGVKTRLQANGIVRAIAVRRAEICLEPYSPLWILLQGGKEIRIRDAAKLFFVPTEVIPWQPRQMLEEAREKLLAKRGASAKTG